MKNRMCFKNVRYAAIFVIILFLGGCSSELSKVYDEAKESVAKVSSQIESEIGKDSKEEVTEYEGKLEVQSIPAYSGESYVVLNNNEPDFSDKDMTTQCFEHYSKRDSLERCGTAYANVCKKIMPTRKRKGIGHIRPSGWHTVKYDCVDGRYLYNRCHLIGYQLSGENANANNLITGTRYMNVEGMLPFEDVVADYVRQTNHHVLYRVTPVYEGKNLVASGVQMEAFSVEDDGEGVCFNVYVYNVQPGVQIDYSTGESKREVNK